MSRELHDLTGIQRPRILAQLASHDNSGEAPGQERIAELRRHLGEMDRRIAYLYTMSSLAEVQPPPPPEGRGRVKFGAYVRVRDEDGTEAEYRIVGVDEADPPRGLIGWPSPVARALIGRQAGEKVVVKLPSGLRTIIVVAVEYR